MKSETVSNRLKKVLRTPTRLVYQGLTSWFSVALPITEATRKEKERTPGELFSARQNKLSKSGVSYPAHCSPPMSMKLGSWLARAFV